MNTILLLLLLQHKLRALVVWESAIKAPTPVKYNLITLHNGAKHAVKAVVFVADERGKMLTDTSTISEKLSPGQVLPFSFELGNKTKAFIVQFQYETGKGVVNCDHQVNGGKFNASFARRDCKYL